MAVKTYLDYSQLQQDHICVPVRQHNEIKQDLQEQQRILIR